MGVEIGMSCDRGAGARLTAVKDALADSLAPS